MVHFAERRKFLMRLGAAAGTALAPWPARAQAVPVIGFLSAGAEQQLAPFAAAFVRGLREGGFVEGQNVHIAYRWASGVAARLPEMAADLVQRRVSLIAAFGTPSARAAKNVVAGTSIPVVFANGSDPVADGLVASLNRPGGNITGVTSIAAEVVPKRLEILRAALPAGAAIAFLINPTNPLSRTEQDATERAARALNHKIEVVTAGTEAEIEKAFGILEDRKVRGLIIATDLLFFGQMPRLAALARQHGIAAIAPLREFVVAGGLMSYGASIADAYRQAGAYAGKVLKGEPPGDLPIMQPTKFDLSVNARTAKALELELPPTLVALADEVLE